MIDEFQQSLVGDLDEPVQRFFTHAIRDGAALGDRVRLTMTGRIKVGAWLPFTAEQTVDGRSFAWHARVGWGSITPLRVVDRYADGVGSTEGRLLGRAALRRPPDPQPRERRLVVRHAALRAVLHGRHHRR